MSTQDLWSEDLAWQARRGFELGGTLCTCDGFYHNLWGALRLSGTNNTMEGETATLASLLAPYLRDDQLDAAVSALGARLKAAPSR